MGQAAQSPLIRSFRGRRGAAAAAPDWRDRLVVAWVWHLRSCCGRWRSLMVGARFFPLTSACLRRWLACAHWPLTRLMLAVAALGLPGDDRGARRATILAPLAVRRFRHLSCSSARPSSSGVGGRPREWPPRAARGPNAGRGRGAGTAAHLRPHRRDLAQPQDGTANPGAHWSPMSTTTGTAKECGFSASDLHERENGITPFECPGDNPLESIV